jgi:NADH:ubiquinone reductase (H+-translocating)
MPTTPEQRPRIVIIGGGFAGIQAARRFRNAPVDVVLLDRNNYHAFWPLLYQVASAGLEPQSIAYPIRGILRKYPNIRFQIGDVQGFDWDRKVVITHAGEVPYDELIIAGGSANNFFGNTSIEEHAFGFKELPEALGLRNHVIMAYEQAAIETDPERRRALLTFVVIGGGPTGVELAGALSELNAHVMRRDYPHLDMSEVRVLLVEMMDRLLLSFPPQLSKKAENDLRKMGVEIHLNTSVTDYDDGVLRFKEGQPLRAHTVVWAAGVQGAKLAETLGVELGRGRRIPVDRELRLPQHPHVWVVGDIAYLEGPNGKPYPQVATVAMQQGRHVAENVLRTLRGEQPLPFKYIDKGSLATIGRSRAVASIWGTRWSGFLAWVLWLGVHILYLVGFRNRVLVLINWAYSYFTYDRGARAVVQAQIEESAPAATTPVTTG